MVLNPCMLLVFPETKGLVFCPSLWSLYNRLSVAMFWSVLVTASWTLSPYLRSSPKFIIFLIIAACEFRIFSFSIISSLVIFLSLPVWTSPMIL